MMRDGTGHGIFGQAQNMNLGFAQKINYHFGIPASGHLCPMLIRKSLEIACYSFGFAQSHRPNLTKT